MDRLREQLHAPLGRLTMAFSALEGSLRWFLSELSGADAFVGSLFSLLPFARLVDAADVTYRRRVPDQDLVGRWESLRKEVTARENERNTFMHSSWGIWWDDWPHVSLSRMKVRVKAGRGVTQSEVPASVDEITEVAVAIEQTNEALIGLLIETSKRGFIDAFGKHPATASKSDPERGR